VAYTSVIQIQKSHISHEARPSLHSEGLHDVNRPHSQHSGVSSTKKVAAK